MSGLSTPLAGEYSAYATTSLNCSGNGFYAPVPDAFALLLAVEVLVMPLGSPA